MWHKAIGFIVWQLGKQTPGHLECDLKDALPQLFSTFIACDMADIGQF